MLLRESEFLQMYSICLFTAIIQGTEMPVKLAPASFSAVWIVELRVQVSRGLVHKWSKMEREIDRPIGAAV